MYDTNVLHATDLHRPQERGRDKTCFCLDADMNNVSHGVAALRDERGRGGTKEEIRVGYAQDYEGGGRARSTGGRGGRAHERGSRS